MSASSNIMKGKLTNELLDSKISHTKHNDNEIIEVDDDVFNDTKLDS